MAKDSKDQQLIELKDTIKELNRTIKNLNELLEAAVLANRFSRNRLITLQRNCLANPAKSVMIKLRDK